MNTRRIVLDADQREKLQQDARQTNDARHRLRCLIVLRWAEGWSRAETAEALGCSVTTVGKYRRQFAAQGYAGLVDRREDNGQQKADESYVYRVQWLLRHRPCEFGHRRPTWTKRLLIKTAQKHTGVTVSKTTMGRVLRTLRARRGRAKPLGPCPWSSRRRRRRMNLIHRLIQTLPGDEAAVWEDEADIDLNPKIGADWTLPGHQRVVMTPGVNKKRYYAAAMDAQTQQVTWVSADRKNSGLFIAMLDRLKRKYAGKKVIHVILDNFTIHSSRQTQQWLSEHGQKFRLHFLPPYAPDDNRIERKVWREVHANVTVNHCCPTLEVLCAEVDDWLARFNRSQLRRRELRVVI